MRALTKRDFLHIKEFKEILCKKISQSNTHYHSHISEGSENFKTDMVPLFVEASYDFSKVNHAFMNVFLVESHRLTNFPLTIKSFFESSEGLW